MTDPIIFTSATARHGLPFLFSGQSQKEVFVNEGFALADLLLHPAVEGHADSPPTAPERGECWLVGDSPTGDWNGYAGNLAGFSGSEWIFVAPRAGLSVLVIPTGQVMRYSGEWQAAEPIAAPSGGSVVDLEARASINAILGALAASGVLPQS